MFVLLYTTNVMNKLKLNEFFKTKNYNLLSVQIFSIIKITHPTFHSEERFVNLVRGRECFNGLSILLVYLVGGDKPLEADEDEGEGGWVDGHRLDKGDDVAGGAAKREPAQPQHADDLHSTVCTVRKF